MAIQSEHELPTGVKGNYWKILQINMDFLNAHAAVTLGLYKDKRAREENKQVLETLVFDWYGEDFPFDLEKLSEPKVNPVTIAYDKIKKMRTEEHEAEVPGRPGPEISFKGARKV